MANIADGYGGSLEDGYGGFIDDGLCTRSAFFRRSRITRNNHSYQLFPTYTI
jgi:hypothetical protein